MISRIWRGWTAPAQADAYETLLLTNILPGIRGREIPGFKGIQLLRRPFEDEVEFMTVMWFDSIEAVEAFAGPAYEIAVVPPGARALLSRFDAKSAHYNIVVPRSSPK
jgi:antibiotic biosynthesis monooxygenase (ABM) superfamily enzyme